MANLTTKTYLAEAFVDAIEAVHVAVAIVQSDAVSPGAAAQPPLMQTYSLDEMRENGGSDPGHCFDDGKRRVLGVAVTGQNSAKYGLKLQVPHQTSPVSCPHALLEGQGWTGATMSAFLSLFRRGASSSASSPSCCSCVRRSCSCADGKRSIRPILSYEPSAPVSCTFGAEAAPSDDDAIVYMGLWEKDARSALVCSFNHVEQHQEPMRGHMSADLD